MKFKTKLTSISMISLTLGFASFNSHANEGDIIVPILGEAEYDYVPEVHSLHNSAYQITANESSRAVVFVPIIGEAEYDYSLDDVSAVESSRTSSEVSKKISEVIVPVLGEAYDDYSS